MQNFRTHAELWDTSDLHLTAMNSWFVMTMRGYSYVCLTYEYTYLNTISRIRMYRICICRWFLIYNLFLSFWRTESKMVPNVGPPAKWSRHIFDSYTAFSGIFFSAWLLLLLLQMQLSLFLLLLFTKLRKSRCNSQAISKPKPKQQQQQQKQETDIIKIAVSKWNENSNWMEMEKRKSTTKQQVKWFFSNRNAKCLYRISITLFKLQQ